MAAAVYLVAVAYSEPISLREMSIFYRQCEHSRVDILQFLGYF